MKVKKAHRHTWKEVGADSKIDDLDWTVIAYDVYWCQGCGALRRDSYSESSSGIRRDTIIMTPRGVK